MTFETKFDIGNIVYVLTYKGIESFAIQEIRINRGIVKTNIDELVGKKVKVVEKVDNIENTGKVVLNGVEWTTRSEADDIAFEAGTLVVVKEVKGVKLIVAKQ